MRIYSSYASLVIVPPNLVQQWKSEIAKHTHGLKVLILNQSKNEVPSVDELLQYEIIIFSSTRFERLLLEGRTDRNGTFMLDSPWRISTSSDASSMRDTSWVTQPPAPRAIFISCWSAFRSRLVGLSPVPRRRALYGVDEDQRAEVHPVRSEHGKPEIGRIIRRSRKGRSEAHWVDRDPVSESPALGQRPRGTRGHAGRLVGLCDAAEALAQKYRRKDCLKATLESLIIRHRLIEIGDLLPVVDEKTVYLDGSYQDSLCLNIFSMFLIFNAVQSQRTDQDYFFHPRQKVSDAAGVQLAAG